MAAHKLSPELVAALKRLKLGRVIDTLPERLALADKQDMPFEDLLLLVLSDEVSRRESTCCRHASLPGLRDSLTMPITPPSRPARWA